MEVVVIESTRPETPDTSNIGVIQVINNEKKSETLTTSNPEVELEVTKDEGIEIKPNTSPTQDTHQGRRRSIGSVVEINGISERKPPPSYSRYNHRRMSNESLANSLSLLTGNTDISWETYVNTNSSSSILKSLNNSMVEVITTVNTQESEKDHFSNKSPCREHLTLQIQGTIATESSNNSQNLNKGSFKHSLSDLSPNTLRGLLPAIAESSFEVDEPPSDVRNKAQEQNSVLVENKESIKDTSDLVRSSSDPSSSQMHEIPENSNPKEQETMSKTISINESQILKMPIDDMKIQNESIVMIQKNFEETSNEKITDNCFSAEDINDHQPVIPATLSKLNSISDNQESYTEEAGNSSSEGEKSSDHHTAMTCILHIDNRITKSKDSMPQDAEGTISHLKDNLTLKMSESNFQQFHQLPQSKNSDLSNDVVETLDKEVTTLVENSKKDLEPLETIVIPDVVDSDKIMERTIESVLNQEEQKSVDSGVQNVIKSSNNLRSNENSCQDVIYIVGKNPDNELTVISNFERMDEIDNMDNNLIQAMSKNINYPKITVHPKNLPTGCDRNKFSTENYTDSAIFPEVSLKDDQFTAIHSENSKIESHSSNDQGSMGLTATKDIPDCSQHDTVVNNDHINLPSEIYELPATDDITLTNQELVTKNHMIRRHSSPILDIGSSIQEINALLTSERSISIQSNDAYFNSCDDLKSREGDEICGQLEKIEVSNIDKHEELDVGEVTRWNDTESDDLDKISTNDLAAFSDSITNDEVECIDEETNIKSKERSNSSPTIAGDIPTINTNVKSHSLLEKCVKKLNLTPFFKKRKSIKQEDSLHNSEISNNIEAMDENLLPNGITNESAGDNIDSNTTSEGDLEVSQQESVTQCAVNLTKVDGSNELLGPNNQSKAESKSVEEPEDITSEITLKNHDHKKMTTFNDAASKYIFVYGVKDRNSTFEHLPTTKNQGKPFIEIVTENECISDEDRQATFLQFSPSIKVDP